MEFLNVLTRNEMKNIKGGDKCGNIYCMFGGEQVWQGSGFGAPTGESTPFEQALSNCIFNEAAGFGSCAQFPELE